MTGNVPAEELGSLRDLYEATQGRSWRWRPVSAGQHWNFTAGANPCSPVWQGITCSLPANQVRHVTQLQLNNYGLNGSIPSSIANLTHMTMLSLQSNSLFGTVPISIGQSMQGLKSLQLNTNQLTGPVPFALFTLSLLSVLEFSHNDLTGVIPSTLGSASSMSQLDLSGNQLGGHIPPSISALSGLTTVVLNNNFLSGPIPDGFCISTGLSKLDLHYNALSSTIPACLANLTTLTYIDLRTNCLTGLLPASIGQLTALQLLRLSDNRLSGTLPRSVGDMTALTILELADNRFHGTIPDSVRNLTHVTQVIMSLNRFSGQIPASLGQMSALTILYLQDNRFSGTLPASLAQLGGLTSMYLSSNNLTGTIPSSFGALPALSAIVLDSNQLEGTIPGELGNATKLAKVSLTSNHLSGSIPATLRNLTRLYTLQVDGNRLTGTFPEFLCAMAEVSSLFLGDNLLSGSLPLCIGNMATVTQIDLSLNQLDGALPGALAEITALQALSVESNYLSGTIPTTLGALQTALVSLLIDDNYLTGSIPASLGGAVNITSLDLKGNLVSGRIPREIGNITMLDVLGLNNNLLTGPIPSTFSELRNMAQLLLSYNFLSGTLEHVFDSTKQLVLYNIQLNNNRLSGALPVDLVTLPSLQHLVVVENCMSGTLPEAVCGGRRVISLILDGLHTAPACRTSLFAPAHTYTISNGMRGTIPACLFNMSALASLHLTGNGFTGTLPNALSLGPHLDDVMLSHNALTGTIPAAFQLQNWYSLDLSYNRFVGTLRGDFGSSFRPSTGSVGNHTFNVTGHFVRLEDNRLSAHIPAALVHLQNVSMLGSNMFSCQSDKSDLPVHDGDRDNYQCGSDSFNGPFFFVVAVVGAAVIAGASLKWSSIDCLRLRETATQLRQWMLPADVLPVHYRRLSALVSVLCRVAVLSTILFVLILSPWYATASHNYGTYTEQYAWVLSAAFLSGSTPAGVEFALYIVLMAVIAAGTELFLSRARRDAGLSGETPASSLPALTTAVQVHLSQCVVASIRIAFLLLNLSVVLGVNIAFVAVALTQSSAVLTLAQILLSAFKLFWINICTPKLIHLVAKLTGKIDESVDFFAVQVFIALFNNIAIPCLVVAVLSPSCFYSAFDAPTPVSSTYTVDECVQRSLTGKTCTYLVPIRVAVHYNPPFAYSYQCSSSFITYYAPSFVYLAIAAGLIMPIAQVLVLRYSAHMAVHSSAQRYLTMLVPRIMKAPASVLHDGKPVFDANKLALSLLTYLGILLTFGAVFPPLAVTMCAALLSVALQSNLSVGRFIAAARELGLSHAVEQIDQECRGAFTLQKLRISLLLILGFCSFFCALFLFDTAGDSVGAKGAYWTLIAMPLAPAAILLAVFLLRRIAPAPPSTKADARESATGTELTEMGLPSAVHASTGESRLESTDRVVDSNTVTSALHKGADV